MQILIFQIFKYTTRYYDLIHVTMKELYYSNMRLQRGALLLRLMAY